MSVEDIQKVNKLAQELLQKGFAEDREDAVKKAQQMLNKEITQAKVEISKTDSRQNVESTGNSEERLRNMIERTKEYVEQQFGAYKNALMGLEKEMRALHQQVQELKSRGVSSPSQHRTEEPQKAETQQTIAPVNQQQKVEKKESNPRTGSHKSDDVSIEKMFYYGNKR